MDGYSKIVLLVCFLITAVLYLVLNKKKLLNIHYSLALAVSFIASVVISLSVPFTVGRFSDAFAVDISIAILLVVLFYIIAVFIFVVLISSVLPKDFAQRLQSLYEKVKEKNKALKEEKIQRREEKIRRREEKIREKEEKRQKRKEEIIQKAEKEEEKQKKEQAEKEGFSEKQNLVPMEEETVQKADDINLVTETDKITNDIADDKMKVINTSKRKNKNNKRKAKIWEKKEKVNKIIENNVDISENIDKMSIGEQSEQTIGINIDYVQATKEIAVTESIELIDTIDTIESTKDIDASRLEIEDIAENEPENEPDNQVPKTDVMISVENASEGDYPATWYIDKAFDCKVAGDLPAAISYYMKGLDSKAEKELIFMIVLDICVIYKQLGQSELAKEILSVYIEKYGDIMSEEVKHQIEQNLI